MSTSDKISISANQVTIIKAGQATITARQPGNAHYNGATPVDQTFCIKPVKPVITTSTNGPNVVQLNSNTDFGNQWYRDGIVIGGAVGKTYLPTQDGSYSVRASIDNCISEFSDEFLFAITGLKDLLKTSMTVYPNPVLSVVHVDLASFESSADVKISIFDTFGKQIKHIHARHLAEVPVDSFAPGMYLLMASQNGRILSTKFIKR